MTDEKKVLAKLNIGDEKTFEFVFKKYFPELCQFAFGIVRSRIIAEEIVEEFFLYLWENAGSININTSIRAYLYRSIYNRCLKYIRHLQVEKKYIDKVPYVFTDEEIYGEMLDDIPLDENEYNNLVKKVENALERLPEQCREIFCLHRYKDQSYAEIATQLGISVNTVKTQMTRALQKLRDMLGNVTLYFIALSLLFL